jgi:hypothetical protein
VSFYGDIPECVARIAELSSGDALARRRRARKFYEENLTDTGFYEQLAAEIARPISA